MKKLLLVALACTASSVVQAQTRRIAHGSHGGSAAALTVVADNMGLPDVEYKKLELVLLSDTTVVVRGWKRWALPNHAWQPMSEKYQFRTFRHDTLGKSPGSFIITPDGTRVLPLNIIKREYPQARLVGFDKPLNKRPAKKPTSRTQTFQHRPFRYGYWRGLATVAALGAVGWRLGRKSKTV